MNLLQLKTELIALADDPAITTAQAGTWINTNYRLLLREHEWPFVVANTYYTVTSGTAEQAFSGMSVAVTDFAKPLRVWISTSSTSDKTSLRPIRYEERNIVGLDGYYYITPNNLSIGILKTPTNSTNVVTIDYLKSTTDLTDSDSPIFISDFHWILVWKALMMYQFQQRENSDEFRIQYEQILSQMLAFYKMPQAASTPVLSGGNNRVRRFGTADPFHLT